MYDILIIGGGISGLYNYVRLINSYKKVLLLEKNDYFGGRIYQYKDTILSEKYEFPAGAARFNHNHKYVISLLKEFDLLDFRRDKPMNAFIKFIDSKNKYKKMDNKNGFYYIDKIISESSKYSENELKKYTFKEFSSFVLKKDELEYMLVASGYSGQLKKMNAFDGIRLFSYGIRPDLKYWGGKFHLLVEKMVNHLKKLNAKMYMNSNVKDIFLDSNTGVHKVLYNNKIIYSKKIIFCIPKEGLLKINILKPIHNILSKSITCKPLCRTYAIFKKEDVWFRDLKEKIVTNNHLRYIIPMNVEKGLIMISYTDDIYTKYWKKIEFNQMELKNKIVKLVKETFKIDINKPVKVIVCYWECGVAYWNKGVDSKKISRAILNPLPNIFICGENYSLNQSWVEGALDSCNNCIELMKKN